MLYYYLLLPLPLRHETCYQTRIGPLPDLLCLHGSTSLFYDTVRTREFAFFPLRLL